MPLAGTPWRSFSLPEPPGYFSADDERVLTQFLKAGVVWRPRSQGLLDTVCIGDVDLQALGGDPAIQNS